MIEKDVILHQILIDLSNDGFFAKKFLFKGGTCLIKHHLGYVRFSEDADFTWKGAVGVGVKSSKAIRRELSEIIDTVGGILEHISRSRDLDFACCKNDSKYVELGGSNKMCTFKVWYRSGITMEMQFIKLQINFAEELCTPHEPGRLRSLIAGKCQRLEGVFPEYHEYSSAVEIDVYSVQEILSEKARAVLTRKGVKMRDFLDMYFIGEKFGITLADIEQCVIRKTQHTLQLYSKYRHNLETNRKRMESGDFLSTDVEKYMILIKFDEAKFQKFVRDTTMRLDKMASKIALGAK